jgi:hypothetical protein
MELDPEVHAHGHRVGTRWIDLSLALAALLVSISSILVALQNHQAMQRLVTANSWPYLELQEGNSLDGEPVVHFGVKNAGIGPAMIEKFVVTYEGQPVHGPHEILERCCGPQANWDQVRIQVNDVNARVLPALETITFLAVPTRELAPELWKKLDEQRGKVGMSVCYSSVFGEYWVSDLGQVRQHSVKSCDELQGPAYGGREVHPP